MQTDTLTTSPPANTDCANCAKLKAEIKKLVEQHRAMFHPTDYEKRDERPGILRAPNDWHGDEGVYPYVKPKG